MRKIISLFVCLVALQTNVWADEDKPIEVSQLPTAAQEFINTHFADRQIALAKMESDLFSKSYDVIFTNGDKAEFDSKGTWTEINCEYSQVPVAIVPEAILTSVNQKYTDSKITKIEKEDRGCYEVKLSNGWELTYDKNFKIIDIEK